MWKQAGVSERVPLVLVGCAVVLLTISAATAEPKAIVVLSSLHHLDYAEAACGHLGIVADIKDITEVVNNASDYDPKDVKFNKQGYDKFNGKFNAMTMLAEERNNYWGLMVDYAPGSRAYSWALFPTARSGRPSGRMISGEGAAFQIAEQVCIVVTGRGTRVR
jgi:hypothetical protein